MDKKLTPEELRKRYEEAVAQSIAAFPYQRIEVEGTEALATWEGLRLTHPGSSSVVGRRSGGLQEDRQRGDGMAATTRPASAQQGLSPQERERLLAHIKGELIDHFLTTDCTGVFQSDGITGKTGVG